jgi:hypothetical protein
MFTDDEEDDPEVARRKLRRRIVILADLSYGGVSPRGVAPRVRHHSHRRDDSRSSLAHKPDSRSFVCVPSMSGCVTRIVARDVGKVSARALMAASHSVYLSHRRNRRANRRGSGTRTGSAMTIKRSTHSVRTRWSMLLASFLIGGTAVAAGDNENLFLAANKAAMSKMMVGMNVRPSGDVDRDFAAAMISHHQGAIEMAEAQLLYGRNEQLRRIAQEIIVTQQEEIAAMKLAIAAATEASK